MTSCSPAYDSSSTSRRCADRLDGQLGDQWRGPCRRGRPRGPGQVVLRVGRRCSAPPASSIAWRTAAYGGAVNSSAPYASKAGETSSGRWRASLSSSRSVRWAGLRRFRAGPPTAGRRPVDGWYGCGGAAARGRRRALAAAVAGPAGQLGDALDDELGVEDAEQPGELDGDLVLERAVLDAGDDRRGLVQRGGAARRGLEVVAGDDLAERELEERGAGFDQVARPPRRPWRGAARRGPCRPG